jgi:hypothetical protein
MHVISPCDLFTIYNLNLVLVLVLTLNLDLNQRRAAPPNLNLVLVLVLKLNLRRSRPLLLEGRPKRRVKESKSHQSRTQRTEKPFRALGLPRSTFESPEFRPRYQAKAPFGEEDHQYPLLP